MGVTLELFRNETEGTLFPPGKRFFPQVTLATQCTSFSKERSN